jgi:hypothetical protein
MNDQKKKNKKWCYAIGIGAASLILTFFVILPLIIAGPKRIPDTNEITMRFQEFLVQPEKIQGIEARRSKESYTIFKYYSKSNNVPAQIERQAVAKGWVKTNYGSPALVFKKEERLSKKIYQYEFVRVSRQDNSHLICVGYDRILSVGRLPDLNNSTDMTVLETITWPQVDACALGPS